MAATTDDLIRVIEEQTTAVKRQNTILGQVEMALADAVGSNEALKAAMMKSGRFTEDKMYAVTQSLAKSMGDFDKGMKANVQMLTAGLEIKGFEGAMETITALGLNFDPFLQLIRHMDRQLGFGNDQSLEMVGHILALRNITKANPELIAKELTAIQNVTRGAAGLFGSDFAQSFQMAVSVLAGDKPELIGQLTQAFSKALGPGAEGIRIRQMLGMKRDPTGMGPSETLSMLVAVLQKTQGSMFGDFMRKSVLGKLVGFDPKDFAAFANAAKNLRGRNPQREMAQAMIDAAKAQASAELAQKWSVAINKILNPMRGVFNFFMEQVRKWSMPLMNMLGDWSDSMAKSMQGILKKATTWFEKQSGALWVKAIKANLFLIGQELKQGLEAMFSPGAFGAKITPGAGGALWNMAKGFFNWAMGALPRFFSNVITFFQNFSYLTSLGLQDAWAVIQNSLAGTAIGTMMKIPAKGVDRINWDEVLRNAPGGPIAFEAETSKEQMGKIQMRMGWQQLQAAFNRGFGEHTGRMERIVDSFERILNITGEQAKLLYDALMGAAG